MYYMVKLWFTPQTANSGANVLQVLVSSEGQRRPSEAGHEETSIFSVFSVNWEQAKAGRSGIRKPPGRLPANPTAQAEGEKERKGVVLRVEGLGTDVRAQIDTDWWLFKYEAWGDQQGPRTALGFPPLVDGCNRAQNPKCRRCTFTEVQVVQAGEDKATLHTERQPSTGGAWSQPAWRWVLILTLRSFVTKGKSANLCKTLPDTQKERGKC